MTEAGVAANLPIESSTPRSVIYPAAAPTCTYASRPWRRDPVAAASDPHWSGSSARQHHAEIDERAIGRDRPGANGDGRANFRAVFRDIDFADWR
jgi:hypothetical protein